MKEQIRFYLRPSLSVIFLLVHAGSFSVSGCFSLIPVCSLWLLKKALTSSLEQHTHVSLNNINMYQGDPEISDDPPQTLVQTKNCDFIKEHITGSRWENIYKISLESVLMKQCYYLSVAALSPGVVIIFFLSIEQQEPELLKHLSWTFCVCRGLLLNAARPDLTRNDRVWYLHFISEFWQLVTCLTSGCQFETLYSCRSLLRLLLSTSLHLNITTLFPPDRNHTTTHFRVKAQFWFIKIINMKNWKKSREHRKGKLCYKIFNAK